MNVSAIAFGHLSAFIDISAVYGKARDGFTNHIAQGLAGKVADITVSGGNGVKHMRQHIHFTGKRCMHDQLLAVIDDSFHVGSSAGKAVIEIGEAPLITPVNEKAI